MRQRKTAKYYFMKSFSIKILFVFIFICAFSFISSAQFSEFENNSLSDSKLKILEMPLPEISEDLRRSHIQGTIGVRVTFLSNSEIGNVQPIKDYPYLTKPVIEAAKKINFEPKIKNGIAITVTRSVQYTFLPWYGWQNALNHSAKILTKPDEEISNEISENETESCLVFLNVELLYTKEIGKIELYENYCKDKVFANKAIELTRKIEFEPALKDGKSITSSDLINFSFQRKKQIFENEDNDY